MCGVRGRVPVVGITAFLECFDGADVYVIIFELERPLAAKFVDEFFGTDAQILFIVDKQAELAADVRKVFVIGSGGEQQHLAVEMR